MNARPRLARKGQTAALAALGALTIAAAGYAAIPSGDGVIHSCYNASSNPSGQLRVIDQQAGAKCAKNEKALDFNQKGPKGDKGDACLPSDPACRGPQGLPGADGADGQDGTNGTDGSDGTDGAPGKDGAPGVSGYEVVDQTFDNALVGGAVYCPPGKRVLGGGGEIYNETSDHQFAIHSSRPVAGVAWFADGTDADRDRDDFINLPEITVWAICAAT
ncbi:MAG: hypothetical protein QOE31_2737 [Solirubrobacteraceae bacterium]|nr:hypothetical protein [Solirubrobacteraceae bacterium]